MKMMIDYGESYNQHRCGINLRSSLLFANRVHPFHRQSTSQFLYHFIQTFGKILIATTENRNCRLSEYQSDGESESNGIVKYLRQKQDNTGMHVLHPVPSSRCLISGVVADNIITASKVMALLFSADEQNLAHVSHKDFPLWQRL